MQKRRKELLRGRFVLFRSGIGDAGRDALYGVRSDKSEGLLSSGTAIGRGHTHDEPSFAASPNTMRTLTECLCSHTNAFLLSAKGVRFLSGSERNKRGCFAFKRIRKIIFLLSAKGSENGKGLFSESAPCNPKTPHTPTNEKRARGKNPPPYLRGQRGFVNKRTNETGTSARQRTRTKQKTGRSYAIKADGKKCRPLFVNFNLTSLSRARKILQALPAKFFGAVP